MTIQSSNNHDWLVNGFIYSKFLSYLTSRIKYDEYKEITTLLRTNRNYILDFEGDYNIISNVYFLCKLNFIYYPVVEQVLLINNKEVLRFAGTTSRYKKEIERFSSMCVNLEYEWVSEIKNVIVKDYRNEI